MRYKESVLRGQRQLYLFNLFSKPKWKYLKRIIPYAVVFIIMSLLLLFRLESVAGLHRDEAAFGLFAEEIIKGLRPITGLFSHYTSPLHSYIIALIFYFFGESIWSLRISGVFFNIIAALIYLDIIRRLLPNVSLSGIWLLVSLPVFVVFSRIAGENYAMNPLFIFGGIWFFCLARDNRKLWFSRMLFSLSGFSFCLGVWNHIISLPTALSIGITYLVFFRPPLIIFVRQFFWFVLGVLVGLFPKIYGVFILNYPWISFKSNIILSNFVPKLKISILNFLYTLGGDALYVRACGEVLFSVNWFLPSIFLGSIASMFLLKLSAKKLKFMRALLFCIILSFLGSSLITPTLLLGSRIWLLPLWFIPIFLAIPISVFSSTIKRIILSIIIAVNIFSISLNYYFQFLKTGGKAHHAVYVGGRFDNSWDFIDMRELAIKLHKKAARPVFIEDFNTNRLKFLLPEDSRKDIYIMPYDFTKYKFPTGALVVFYRPLGLNEIEPQQDIGLTKMRFLLDFSTRHYLVYEVISSH